MTVPQRYGITFPFDGIPLVEQREIVQRARRPRLHRPVVGGVGWLRRVHAARGRRAVGARRCASAPRSCPCTRAARTRSRRRSRRMCQAAPGRFALGIGTSSNVIVERWNGMPFEKPYQRVRDTIRFLRAALAGEKVTEEYETFAVNGFRLGITVPEQPPILVAALREGMLRLAGREGDGAIINWLSADDVKTVVPHVGADKEIVARIFVFPIDDAGLGARGRQARDRVVSHRAGVRRVPRVARPRRRARRPVATVEGRRPQGRGRVDPRPRRRRAARVGQARAVPRAHPALHRQRRHDTRARVVLRPRPAPRRCSSSAQAAEAVTRRS